MNILVQEGERMDIIPEALWTIDSQYGVDYVSFRNGLHGLPYHNGFHTRNVIQDFNKLSASYEMSAAELKIGRMACSAHDIVQGEGRGQDETQSAHWLDAKLAKTELWDSPLRGIAKLAIMGTLPIFEGSVMIDQAANRQDYPSKQHEVVAKMLASADMGKLFTGVGPYISHHLLHEIIGPDSDDNLLFDKVLGFQRGQPQFLATYTFPLNKAHDVLGKNKAAVVDYADGLIDTLEKGDIENWQQLLAKDLEFARLIGCW